MRLSVILQEQRNKSVMGREEKFRVKRENIYILNGNIRRNVEKFKQK